MAATQPAAPASSDDPSDSTSKPESNDLPRARRTANFRFRTSLWSIFLVMAALCGVSGCTTSSTSSSAGSTAPTIASLSPTDGAVGTSITITGTNFGSSQGTSTVTFNGIAATATTWSATSIVTTVPSIATTGNVVVTVNGVASNGQFFVVPAIITQLSASSGAVGSSLLITGSNFGASQGSSTVTFNGASAGTATAWSATSITVTVPVGATPGNVVVTVSSVASNGVSFTPGPSIIQLSATSGAIGTSITITGVNFGATQGSSTVTFNTALATPASWSNQSIVVPVPVGATTGNVVVKVGTLASNGSFFTVTVPPQTTSLSSDSGAATTDIACGNSPTGDEAMLNGTYVFFLQGWTGSPSVGAIATINSFQANGSGWIVGGEGDMNGVGLASGSHYTIESTATSGGLSKYTVGKDPTNSGDIGCVSLTTSLGSTFTYEFSLGKASGGVYTKGRIVRFDDTTGTGIRGSGVLLKQTPAEFGYPSASTNYAFGESGWNSEGAPFEGAGFVTVSTTGSFTNLSADFDLEGLTDFGLATGPVLGATNNNGGFTAAPDATAGYALVTDNFADSSTTVTYHYANYEVNSDESFFLSTDPPSGSVSLAVGRAIVSSSSFTGSSLSGDYIIHQTGTVFNSHTGEISLGLVSFTPGSPGTVGGSIFQYESGSSATSETPTGTYTINSTTGRVALSGSPSGFGTSGNVPVFYIAAPVAGTTEPINGFAAGTDGDATFGLLESSAGSGFTTAGLNGNYFFGNEQPGDNTVVDGIGVVAVSGGSGGCVGTQYLSGPSGSSSVGLSEQTLSPCQVSITNANGFGNVGTGSVFLTNGQSFYYFEDSSGSTAEIVAGDTQ